MCFDSFTMAGITIVFAALIFLYSTRRRRPTSLKGDEPSG